MENAKESKGGVIYILTNPSFPDYVKIGYADNLENRLASLNRSECIPFAFRAYAVCHVQKRLADKDVHKIFDIANPELRSKEVFNGKERTREFFQISAEDAFQMLQSAMLLTSSTDNVKRIEPTAEQRKDEQIASEVRQGNVLRNEFWGKFSEYFQSRSNLFGDQKLKSAYTWWAKSEKRIEFRFYITLKSVKVLLIAKQQDKFEKLLANRATFNKSFTQPPIWDIANTQITLENECARIMEKDTWGSIFEWLTTSMLDLKKSLDMAMGS